MENENNVKIGIEVPARSVEVVNRILSTAYEEFSAKRKLSESFGLSVADVISIELFRQKLLKSYFNIFEKNNKEDK